jgi:hypothetical protein
MKRKALISLLFGAFVLTGGCAEDTPEIFVVGNQSFTETCEVPVAGRGNATLRTRGVLDLFVTSAYQMVPWVENRLVDSGTVRFSSGNGDGLVGQEWEANDIILQRALIRYEAPEALGVPLPRELELDLSGALPPTTSASIEMQVITPSIGRTLANSRILREGTSLTLNLRIKFFGVTSSGNKVDSNEFVYPIELCYGCLLSTPPDAIDPDFPVQPNCRNSELDEELVLEDLCFTGQDVLVDCRVVCPLVNATPNGDPEGICEPQVGF